MRPGTYRPTSSTLPSLAVSRTARAPPYTIAGHSICLAIETPNVLIEYPRSQAVAVLDVLTVYSSPLLVEVSDAHTLQMVSAEPPYTRYLTALGTHYPA